MDKLIVIKIGGNIIDDEIKLSSFLKAYAAVKEKKILIHGGGKLATRLAAKLGIEQQMINGRRITDAETLKLVTMVYAGYINKNIVAQLQAAACNAIGISGADGNAVLAHKRVNTATDFGFVGDVDAVQTDFLNALVEKNYCPVLAPITHDGKGQLLNTNADTIAQEIAKAMSSKFEVSLVYSFEKAGVLLDTENENSVIPVLHPDYYLQLKNEGKIFAGMIPKLDNAFAAIEKGVKRVIIGDADNLTELISGKSGTSIEHG